MQTRFKHKIYLNETPQKWKQANLYRAIRFSLSMLLARKWGNARVVEGEKVLDLQQFSV